MRDDSGSLRAPCGRLPFPRGRPGMRDALWTRAGAPVTIPRLAPGLDPGRSARILWPGAPAGGATRRGAADHPVRTKAHSVHGEGAPRPRAEGARLRAARADVPRGLQALEPGDGAPPGADHRLRARLGLDGDPAPPRRALPEAAAPRRGSGGRRAAAPARGLGRRVLSLLLEPLARPRAAPAGDGGGELAPRAAAPPGPAPLPRLAARGRHLGAPRDGAPARGRRPPRRPREPARGAALLLRGPAEHGGPRRVRDALRAAHGRDDGLRPPAIEPAYADRIYAAAGGVHGRLGVRGGRPPGRGISRFDSSRLRLAAREALPRLACEAAPRNPPGAMRGSACGTHGDRESRTPPLTFPLAGLFASGARIAERAASRRRAE